MSDQDVFNELLSGRPALRHVVPVVKHLEYEPGVVRDDEATGESTGEGQSQSQGQGHSNLSADHEVRRDNSQNSDVSSRGDGDEAEEEIPPELLVPENSQFHFQTARDFEIKYRGLDNQGATCYLNSLLQSLFMTPEFRNAVFRWVPPEDEDGDKSIPFQLARLFALLQAGSRSSVSTKKLTASFGWDSGEAFEQHDVQELCRVLFEALEIKFAGTPQENLINRLYEGEMLDYVKCRECGHQSARSTPYMDVSLVIRPFGSDARLTSVMEGFDKFVEIETLDGPNQYSCEKCNKKVDAEKGLKFKSFPYLLTLQLKRFDYDYDLGRRIKLNDKVVFPLTLNLSKYVDTPQGQDPPVFELFSVMIHSGSAWGGHYYGYIRSFENGRWYDFNDSSVSEITVETIKRAYGGTTTSSYPYSHNSATNCYMLFYRQISPSRNEVFLPLERLPKYLSSMLEEETAKESVKRAAEEAEKNTVKLEIHFYDPKTHKCYSEIPVAAHNSLTINELITKVFTEHTQVPALTGDVSQAPSECRVRRFVPYRRIAYDVFENLPLSKCDIRGYTQGLLFEMTGSDGKFEEFVSGIRFYHVQWVEGNGVVRPPTSIAFHPDKSVEEFRRVLGVVFHAENVHIIYSNIYRYLCLLPDTGDLFRVDGTDGLYALSFTPPPPQVPDEDTEDPVEAIGSPTEMKSLIEDEDDAACSKTPPNNVITVIPASPKTRTKTPHYSTLSQPSLLELIQETDMFKSIEQARNSVVCNLYLPDAKDPIRYSVDQRVTVEQFKDMLVDVVGLPANEFKVYYTYSKYNDYQMELDILSSNLTYKVENDTNVYVKRGQALKAGEHYVDVSLYGFSEYEYAETEEQMEFKPIVRDGMTIREFKEMMRELILEKKVDIPVDKMRVITKYAMSKVCSDDMKLKDDIVVSVQLTLVIIPLPEPEMKHVKTQTCVRLCHWHPSSYVLDKAIPIVFDSEFTIAEIKAKASEVSSIPVQNIELLKVGYRSWYHSILDIQDEDGWDHYKDGEVVTNSHPVYYMETGWFFFRDKTEEAKTLSKEEKDTIKKTEEAKTATKRNYYHRKEKALKINVHDKNQKSDPEKDPSKAESDNARPSSPKMIIHPPLLVDSHGMPPPPAPPIPPHLFSGKGNLDQPD